MPDAWFTRFLACPDCRRPLDLPSPCACGFAVREGTPPDLRPQNPRPRTIDVRIGSVAPADLAAVDVTNPRITYDGPRAERDSSELFSAAVPWLRRGGHLLDLGCGPRDQAVPAQHLGLQYAGVDWSSPAADLLADAHAIPFQDATFDAVLSYAVLEHLYNPFAALGEIARVLRPGGIYFGSVSQGEPFHDSYFHHTAWGVLHGMREAGLRVVRLWPSYDTLHALSSMGRYARAHKLLIELVHRFISATPLLAPRSYFHSSRREKAIERLYRAASILFVAERAGDP
ncbi:MAG TPA: class I SAM-dependent methyltransferase [Thermoanaerobaculia bacterium]|nr:class I SAM-dependent methyltransferase [Thermoanaerobaculia bacterium]